MKKIRILSIDGGGMRGIIPATTLVYIEKKLQQETKNLNVRLANYFDLIVGTSTGAILGGFLVVPNAQSPSLITKKYTAQQALDFYVKEGYSIFNASKKRGMAVRRLFNATTYKPYRLEEIFENVFGELRLEDIPTPFVATTYDLLTQKAFFFSSLDNQNEERSFLMKDVMRATSAAPTYFPAAKIQNYHTGKEMYTIDGGVFANNPALCAYAEAREIRFDKKPFPKAKDMLLLSLGTGGGQIDLPNAYNSPRWGVFSWAKSAPNIMLDGSAETVDYQLKRIFKTLSSSNQANYKRIDFPADITKPYDKDMAEASSKNIAALKSAGQITLEHAQQQRQGEHTLDTFIKQLIINH